MRAFYNMYVLCISCSQSLVGAPFAWVNASSGLPLHVSFDNISHSFSMGFRWGQFASQSSTFLWSLNKILLFLALVLTLAAIHFLHILPKLKNGIGMTKVVVISYDSASFFQLDFFHSSQPSLNLLFLSSQLPLQWCLSADPPCAVQMQ